MKPILLLTILLATIELQAQTPPLPDFSDCNVIASRIQTETNKDIRLKLSMQLLDCANAKITEARLARISLPATNGVFMRTPPPPPMPSAAISITNSPSVTIRFPPLDGPIFTVTCPKCHLTYRGILALNIVTNGWRQTPDDKVIYDRTIVLPCPNVACQYRIKAANQKVVPLIPETIATEDEPLPIGGSGASSVLPDTNAPSITLTNLRAAKMTDFTNQVPVSYLINSRNFYWLDPETGQPVTKAFNLRFQALSNQFYTVWISSPISGHEADWREYPSHGQLHPARFDFLAGLAIPLYETNRFVAVRSFNGGNRVTWQ